VALKGIRNILDGLYDTVDAVDNLGRVLGRFSAHGRMDLPIVGEASPPAQLGPGPAYPFDLSKPSATPARTAEVKTIEDRIKYISNYAQRGREDPRVREFAIKAVSKRCGDKWCASETDNWQECQALFAALKQAYRYTGDVYGKDTYQHPGVTLDFGGADCDDAASLVGATFGSIGYTVYLRVIETKDSPTHDWDHIYNLVGLPRDAPVSVIPIDLAAIGKPAGWQVPEKMIKRKKDFLIP